MNIERLTQLRRLAIETPAELLDMQFLECGTARCLAGHAYYDPWFQENTEIQRAFQTLRGALVWTKGTCQRLADIFDISNRHVEAIFVTFGGQPSQGEVVANLDRILAGQEPQLYTLRGEN